MLNNYNNEVYVNMGLTFLRKYFEITIYQKQLILKYNKFNNKNNIKDYSLKGIV